MSTSLTGATPSVSKVKGTGYNQVTMPTMEGGQRSLFDQLLAGVQGGSGGALDFLSKLARGGDESMWAQLEGPALRQFGQLQGDIASRFSGMGSGGRRSSGFHNMMGGAAADLAERLQSQRMGLQSQAVRDLLNMGQSLMTTPLTESYFMPKKKPFWQDLASSGAEGLGTAIGMLPFLL